MTNHVAVTIEDLHDAIASSGFDPELITDDASDSIVELFDTGSCTLICGEAIFEVALVIHRVSDAPSI